MSENWQNYRNPNRQQLPGVGTQRGSSGSYSHEGGITTPPDHTDVNALTVIIILRFCGLLPSGNWMKGTQRTSHISYMNLQLSQNNKRIRPCYQWNSDPLLQTQRTWTERQCPKCKVPVGRGPPRTLSNLLNLTEPAGSRQESTRLRLTCRRRPNNGAHRKVTLTELEPAPEHARAWEQRSFYNC